jgi:hypothetical protein
MSRLHSLFESTSSPSQIYARQPLLTQRFERDPSLKRVLVQKEYFDGIPQRVSVIGHLIHQAVQKAKTKSGAAPNMWDAVIGSMASIMASFDQDLALAGHLTDHMIPSMPTVTVQGSLISLWSNLLKDRTNHKALVSTMEIWGRTVNDLAEDPASNQYAPAYTKHAEALQAFCGSLANLLKSAPDAEIVEPTFANTLSDKLAESNATDEAATPRNFTKAMNHNDTQKSVSDSIAWMIDNTSGALWSGELLNFMSSLDDVADYIKDMNYDSMFSGELDGKTSRKIATSLNYVSTAVQRTLLNGLTQGLREAGVWEEPPADASYGNMPANLSRLFNDYDYLDLRDNLLFALASVGGKSLITMYSKVPVALLEAASAIETGKLLAGLTDNAKAQYKDALTQTARKLEQALQPIRQTFNQVGMLTDQVPANRLIN